MKSGEIIIKSDREYLREACEEVSRHHYAIPAFQRDFVWKEQQVIDLFDSVTKGYPIGSLILWKSSDRFRSVDMQTGEIVVDNPDMEYYILDGRQRVTAFYNVVTGNSRDKRFALYYNLESGKFEYYRRSKDAPLHLVRVSDLFDTFKLLGVLETLSSKIDDAEKRERYLNEAKYINVRLQNYTVAEVKIDQCSIEDAREVFLRVNSKGTDISKADMTQALLFSKDAPTLSQVILDIQNALSVYDFDMLTADDILNCLITLAGASHYDTPIDKLKQLHLISNPEVAKRAIMSTAKFLHDDCYILSGKILPYKNQFIALAEFFNRVPSPTPAQIKELKKWVLYTTVNQSFQNGSLSNLRKLFREIQKYATGASEAPMAVYEPVTLKERWNASIRSSSASASWLFMLLTYHYKNITESDTLQYIESAHFDGTKPEHYFVCLNTSDKRELAELLNTDIVSAPDHNRHCLPGGHQMPKSQMYRERKNMIRDIESNLLNSYGISCIPGE